MSSESASSGRGRAIVVIAAIFVILAGLKAAASLVDPLLLATFVAILAAPAVGWLIRHRVPQGVAVLLVILLVVVVLGGVGAVIGKSVADFSGDLPRYQVVVGEKADELVALLRSSGVKVPEGGVSDMVDTGNLFGLLGGFLSSLAGMLGDGLMIMFTVLFILLEASTFPTKFAATFGESVAASESRQKFLATLKKYITIKTAISLVSGLAVGVLVWLAGVGFPMLWGLLAFLLNFVPTIGPLIAVIPPTVLALVDGGLTKAIVVALGIVIINTISGNVLEPRLLGKGLGLSPLVVFLSLIIWGWILGPIGMILSIPLTVTLKIGMDSDPDTRWIGTLLGTGEVSGGEVEAKKGAAVHR